MTHNARISVSYESGGSAGSGGASGNTFGVTGSSQATEEVVNGTWRLHIRQLKESDRDCYMCQINTSPMISELGCLDIHGTYIYLLSYLSFSISYLSSRVAHVKRLIPVLNRDYFECAILCKTRRSSEFRNIILNLSLFM